MEAEEISDYKDKIVKEKNYNDKRNVTDEDLLASLIPIESDPRFKYNESDNDRMDKIELKLHNNPHDDKVAEICITKADSSNDGIWKIATAIIVVLFGGAAYIKGRHDQHKKERKKGKPEN